MPYSDDNLPRLETAQERTERVIKYAEDEDLAKENPMLGNLIDVYRRIQGISF